MDNRKALDSTSTFVTIFKYNVGILSKPFSLIINQYLAQGIFPDILKTVAVTPIQKKEDIRTVDNCCP